MKFLSSQDSALDLTTPCLVIGVFDQRERGAVARAFDERSGGLLEALIDSRDFLPKLGRTLLLPKPAGVSAARVLLVGLGDASALDGLKFQRAVVDAGRALNGGPFDTAATTLATIPVRDRSADWVTETAAIATAWACYRYTATVKPKPEPKLETLTVIGADAAALARAEAIANGVRLTRELGDLPPNLCNPEYLAQTARRLAESHPSISVEVLEREQMAKLGMGALLAVARGSANAPKLIVIKHTGTTDEATPVVLVGKGITFDTGGISLKEAGQMDEMKYDMGGAASVFGALQAAAELTLKLNVVGIVAAVENMPDGDSYRPGDVLTSMSGQTIEVLNTDAEGRLILCDALTYAQRFKPQALIDIATLTGACVVALGKVPSGLMSKTDALAREIDEAANGACDRVWRLQLWDDYSALIDSPWADMANIGGKYGGAITAGMFLARFTDGQPWAHLDIAGTAWEDRGKGGATGRPVPLLVEFLRRRAG